MLGSIIAIIVFIFGTFILFKRIQLIKQTALGSIHGGKHYNGIINIHNNK